MFILLRFIFLFVVCGGIAPAAWAEKKPLDHGGKGTLESKFLGECFKTASRSVIEVCGQYKINWKLWTLMGEPVGDYNVAWRLTEIKLMDPKRKLVRSFTPDTLPGELKKPSRAIELYLDGYATVNGSQNIYHRFNTGVAVRADAGSSINTPGSTDWDKFFAEGTVPCEPLQGILQKTTPGKTTYLHAKTAKSLFIQGIQLTDFRLCKESAVYELTSLENAIASMCEKPGADKRHEFCPTMDEKPEKESRKEKEGLGSRAKHKSKQEESASGLAADILDGKTTSSSVDIHDQLDEVADRPMVQKRLAQEVAAFRRAAEPACRNTMRDIDACYAANGCKRVASSPSIDQCRSIPAYPRGRCYPFCLTKTPGPGDVCYKKDAECRAAMAQAEREEAREKEELQRQQQEWESRYKTLASECNAVSKERERFASCQKQFDTTCNPKRFSSMNDCLDEQVRISGPTEKDARKLMKKTWDDRSKNGSSITNSILD